MSYAEMSLSLVYLLATLVFGLLPLLFVREWWIERGRSHVSRRASMDPAHRLAITMVNPANLRYVPVDPDEKCSRCGHFGSLDAKEVFGVPPLVELYSDKHSICRFCLRDLSRIFREAVDLWQRHDKVFESKANKDKEDEGPGATPPLNTGEIGLLGDALAKFKEQRRRRRKK